MPLRVREDLAGTSLILKYIARQAAAEGKSSSLYGQDALAACQVDQWLDVTAQVVSGLGFEPMCVSINNYLSLRTFLVGYTFTVADVALWGQLQGNWSVGGMQLLQVSCSCCWYHASILGVTRARCRHSQSEPAKCATTLFIMDQWWQIAMLCPVVYKH